MWPNVIPLSAFSIGSMPSHHLGLFDYLLCIVTSPPQKGTERTNLYATLPFRNLFVFLQPEVCHAAFLPLRIGITVTVVPSSDSLVGVVHGLESLCELCVSHFALAQYASFFSLLGTLQNYFFLGLEPQICKKTFFKHYTRLQHIGTGRQGKRAE